MHFKKLRQQNMLKNKVKYKRKHLYTKICFCLVRFILFGNKTFIVKKSKIRKVIATYTRDKNIIHVNDISID